MQGQATISYTSYTGIIQPMRRGRNSSGYKQFLHTNKHGAGWRFTSLVQQCDLLSIHRSGLYYTPCAESEENLVIMRLLDEQYFKTPFYGIRRLTAWLQQQGYNVNRKRVKRLMSIMGWKTLFRGRRTSDPNYDAPQK